MTDDELGELLQLTHTAHTRKTAAVCAAPRAGRCTCGETLVILCATCHQFLAATGSGVKGATDVTQLRTPPCCGDQGGHYTDLTVRPAFAAPV